MRICEELVKFERKFKNDHRMIHALPVENGGCY